MILRSQKIITTMYSSVLLLSLFVPHYSQAQIMETTTNPTVSDTSESVVETTSVYSPNEVLPATDPPVGSKDGTIVRNLRSFGEMIGLGVADPRTILARLIKSGLGFVGIIVLVLILWSGLSFMLSGGDEERSKNAGRIFFNTLIGLFIILAAYSIVTFVINTFTGGIAGTSPTVPTTNPVTPDPVVNP